MPSTRHALCKGIVCAGVENCKGSVKVEKQSVLRSTPPMATKKIVLIGDSIRMGYEPIVREKLAGTTEVWGPSENCRHSIEHLLNFDAWYLSQNPDLIHFNFGLWDCRRLMREHEESLIPVEIFARNLDVILTMLMERSRAKLVWATITPVIQERHRAKFTEPEHPFRVSADVGLYNATAAPILAKHGVAVNDLGGFVRRNRPEEIINEDGVHYTEAGYALLGEEVTKQIAAAVG